MVPYYSRAQWRAPTLSGKALLWVDDPFDLFFLEMQGSGRMQLADNGETVRLAFADQNGHPYNSIGRWLIDNGELTSRRPPLQGIKA